MKHKILLLLLVFVATHFYTFAQVPHLVEWMSYYPAGDLGALPMYDTSQNCAVTLVNARGLGRIKKMCIGAQHDTSNSNTWDILPTLIGDFNGDSVPDYFLSRLQEQTMYYGTVRGVPPSENSGVHGIDSVLIGADHIVFDFNNDGKDDILALNTFGIGDVVPTHRDSSYGYIIFGAPTLQSARIERLEIAWQGRELGRLDFYKDSSGNTRVLTSTSYTDVNGVLQEAMYICALTIPQGSGTVRFEPKMEFDMRKDTNFYGPKVLYGSMGLWHDKKTRESTMLAATKKDGWLSITTYKIYADTIHYCNEIPFKPTVGSYPEVFLFTGKRGFISSRDYFMSFNSDSTWYLFSGNPASIEGQIPRAKYEATYVASNGRQGRLSNPNQHYGLVCLGDINNDLRDDFAMNADGNLLVFVGAGETTSVPTQNSISAVGTAPHPVQRGAMFTLTLASNFTQSVQSTVTLIDLQGTTVGTLYSGLVTTGNNALQCATPVTISTGMYAIKVQSGTNAWYKTILVTE